MSGPPNREKHSFRFQGYICRVKLSGVFALAEILSQLQDLCIRYPNNDRAKNENRLKIHLRPALEKAVSFWEWPLQKYLSRFPVRHGLRSLAGGTGTDRRGSTAAPAPGPEPGVYPPGCH